MTGWIVALALYTLGVSEQFAALMELREEGDEDVPLWYCLIWPLTAFLRGTMK